MSAEEHRTNLILITGGARSGKSLLAESMASASGLPVHYVATMERWPDDPEGARRIANHRSRRPSGWSTHEVARGLDAFVAALSGGPSFVVIDCLSLYVSNMLLAGGAENPYEKEGEIQAAVASLLRAIGSRSDLTFLTVTNEVGWGVVPENRLARAYRDILGTANQCFAASAREVWLVCAGLKIQLK